MASSSNVRCERLCNAVTADLDTLIAHVLHSVATYTNFTLMTLQEL